MIMATCPDQETKIIKYMEHHHLSRGLVAKDHLRKDKQDYVAFKYTGPSVK